MKVENGVLLRVTNEDIIDGKFEFPEGITAIDDRAFAFCDKLIEIDIPDGVISIGDSAFDNCIKLEKIHIPEGVTSIGKTAFYECIELREVNIPEGVTSINKGTFLGCISLTQIKIPEDVTTIESSAFRGCKSLTQIKIPQRVTSINNSTFLGCSSLTQIEIPKGVTIIGDSAFLGCNSLSQIKIPEGVMTIGEGAFRGCKSLIQIKIPKGVTSIGNSAFFGCSNLTQIEILEGITTIRESTFYGCSSLNQIEIPKGVTSIEEGAFKDCINLNQIEIPKGVTSIGNSAFYGCNLRKIEIPKGVTTIRENTFNGCRGLSHITIPKGVTSIKDGAFNRCSSLSQIEIPEGITIIGDETFADCSNLTKIEIPEGVMTIGEGAFKGCSSLSQIEIPEGITIIGDKTFANCSNLTKIEIPEGVTSIGNSAFSACSSLNKINIPKGVTNIGAMAFMACSNLMQIEIPEEVTIINNSVFSSCSNLTQIEIPKGVTSIGNTAFYDCSSLTQIEIPKGVTSIGINALHTCRNLKKAKYGNNIWDSSSNIKNILLNKYGLVILTDQGVNVLFKDSKELIELGYIDKNLSQEKKDEQEKTLKGQLEAIYNSINFKISKNYNQDQEIDYLNKIINVIGVSETENLLKIPNGISVEDIKNYGKKLLEIYESKNKLNGSIPLVILMLDNIDTVISEKSKDIRNDRNKFYTKFNELLEDSNNDLTLEELLSSCASQVGLELEESQIQKIKKELQIIQLTEKSDEIKNKLQEKLNSPKLDIMQTGVSSTLVYNVIRQNLLNGGRLDDIEEIFEKEISRTTSDGTRYYGTNIQNQKDKLKKVVEELYVENSELLNSNMVDILRDTKKSIGDRWILRLKNSRNNIRDLQSMTEEEKSRLIENLEKNEINVNLSFSKKYELKPNVSFEKAMEVLSKQEFPEVLTYEKAEMIFSNMKEPVSEKFGTWFIENKKEIMRNQRYYTTLATLHNEFEAMLQDPIICATYENKDLTPELAFNVLNSIEKEGRPGNEELSRLASSVNMSNEEFTTAQDIFEVTKKREKSYIPPAQSSTKKYRGRILRADDPMNILAGNATDCCQKVGDVGDGSMVHASIEDNGRIFIVEELDEKGEVVKPVAQSWVWRNKDTVCFDNIEIAEVEKLKLKKEDGDKKAQQEILEIYKECAKNMVKQDEKMLGKLLTDSKITQEMYNQLVIKTVRVGTGFNDLGILTEAGLEVVPEKDMLFPKEKEKDYKEYKANRPWVDSGISSKRGEGAQLYLVKEEKPNTSKEELKYDLEDLPVKPMYHNEREVRKLKSRTIDKGVVNTVRQIENKVYKNGQKLLYDCTNYKELADVYRMNENDVQVYLSREKDWYLIFKNNEEELYIADLSMVNEINNQDSETVKTDMIQQTLEIEESLYCLMLNAEKEDKQIRLEATENTYYLMLGDVAEKGLINIEEDSKRDWSNRGDIQIHDMKVTVNKEKMEEELKKVQEMLAKKREEALFRKVEDKDDEGR